MLHHAGYKWVVRMDTDSRLPAHLPYDLAATMEAQNATYGFRAETPDAEMTLTGLMEAVAFWAVTEQVQPTFLLEHCEANQLAGTGGLPKPHGHHLQVFCRWGTERQCFSACGSSWTLSLSLRMQVVLRAACTLVPAQVGQQGVLQQFLH